jgi:hypothetical protein
MKIRRSHVSFGVKVNGGKTVGQAPQKQMSSVQVGYVQLQSNVTGGARGSGGIVGGTRGIRGVVTKGVQMAIGQEYLPKYSPEGSNALRGVLDEYT